VGAALHTASVEAARPSRHAVGERWLVDETYLKVAGVWRYLYRAIDQFGQVIDVLLSPRRDARATRRFFLDAISRSQAEPAEVVTDRALAYLPVLDALLPGTFHDVEQYANNALECDHGRLKARLRPMRSLKSERTASVVVAGHAFVQNVRRGHYELGVDVPRRQRLVEASAELALTV
jgi:transposase-like protein